MKNRRQGIMTDTGHARRWHDKLFGFTLGLLLIFLLNWILGCSAVAPVTETSRYPAPDCSEGAAHEDFRCTVYMPEEEIDYEDADGVDLEDVEFE